MRVKNGQDRNLYRPLKQALWLYFLRHPQLALWATRITPASLAVVARAVFISV